MPLINCKVELSINWIKRYLLTAAKLEITKVTETTDAKLYVPVVTSSAEDNAKLSKILTEGFKRTLYWNEQKVIDNKVEEVAANNEEKYIRELLDSSWQAVKRLFVLAYNNKGDNKVSVDSYKKYFLPTVKIEN